MKKKIGKIVKITGTNHKSRKVINRWGISWRVRSAEERRSEVVSVADLSYNEEDPFENHPDSTMWVMNKCDLNYLME